MFKMCAMQAVDSSKENIQLDDFLTDLLPGATVDLQKNDNYLTEIVPKFNWKVGGGRHKVRVWEGRGLGRVGFCDSRVCMFFSCACSPVGRLGWEICGKAGGRGILT